MLLKGNDSRPLRWLFGIGGCLLLIAVFVFQGIDYWSHFGMAEIEKPYLKFAFNKAVRMVANDFGCFAIIIALFNDRRHLNVAFFIFLIELFIILPIYLALKLHFEGVSEVSSPVLAQVHRLIVNPMLMILLIIGFIYQALKGRVKSPLM